MFCDVDGLYWLSEGKRRPLIAGRSLCEQSGENLRQDLNKQRHRRWLARAGPGRPDRIRPCEITHCHLQISPRSISTTSTTIWDSSDSVNAWIISQSRGQWNAGVNSFLFHLEMWDIQRSMHISRSSLIEPSDCGKKGRRIYCIAILSQLCHSNFAVFLAD